VVWLRFDPQAGHEQADRRPALVISPRSYNEKIGLALFCPVTTRIKDYPFEVALPAGGEISGVVLADQIKSLDWRARRAERVATAPPEVVREVLAKARVLVL
jgi:mRNA interferase MazF